MALYCSDGLVVSFSSFASHIAFSLLGGGGGEGWGWMLCCSYCWWMDNGTIGLLAEKGH